MSSFHVDARVNVKLEYELAMRLGEFILSSGTEDKQFLALGHKLVSIDEDENSKPKKNWENFYEDNESNPINAVTDTYWQKSFEKVGGPPIKISRKYNDISK